MTSRRFFEAIGVGSLGGLLAACTGSAVGLTVPLAVVGTANGVVSGWRQVYEWSCSRGSIAFTLDSTWGLAMTTAGVLANAFGAVSRSSGYSPEMSRRQNRHVYRRGFMPRNGFAITLGNVIGGAGDIERERRRRLITNHEDVHCWQSRWFGPFYPLIYVGWMVGGGAVGMAVWLIAHRGEPFTKVVESSAYYLNPFEWWAYSRDAHWPPSGKVPDLGWKRPCCRPLAVVKART